MTSPGFTGPDWTRAPLQRPTIRRIAGRRFRLCRLDPAGSENCVRRVTPANAWPSGPRRTLTGRCQPLLLLLQVLRDTARAFDRELLDLPVRRARERVEKARHLVELARLEQRLEVV